MSRLSTFRRLTIGNVQDTNVPMVNTLLSELNPANDSGAIGYYKQGSSMNNAQIAALIYVPWQELE